MIANIAIKYPELNRDKTRLTRLEKQSVSPKVEVLWVDVDSGETHEGIIKYRYGDQVPPGVEPVTVSWLPQS